PGRPLDRPCRTAGRNDRSAPAWLWCPVPLGVAGSCPELPGSRQSPDPSLVEPPLDPGPLPSSAVVLSAECHRYYEPLRLPTRLHPLEGARRTPRRVGSPVLPCVLCRRATPLTPASESMVIGRVLPWTPAAFPVIQAGRLSRLPFRGLLRLYTCCGPSARLHPPGGAFVPATSASTL